MFEDLALDYTSVGKLTDKKFQTDLYSFKCTLNIYYVVEIEKFDNHVLIIKFFQKNHRDSDNKYSLTNTDKFIKLHGFNVARNFLIILHTVTKIVLDNYLDDNNCSFGFIGSPKKIELSSDNKINQNDDGTVKNTQRYRIYSSYLKRYFSPESFEHIDFPTSSAYLIKRRLNTTLTTREVELFFEQYIQEYC